MYWGMIRSFIFGVRGGDYTYQDVKPLSQNLPPGTLLIDVRDTKDFEREHIPNAVSMPYIAYPNALEMSETEFKETFNFGKPKLEDRLVFYCAHGMGCRGAEYYARDVGYNDTAVYVGSIRDWKNNEK